MKRGEVGENIVGRYGMAVGREHVTAATASPSKCKGTTVSWQSDQHTGEITVGHKSWTISHTMGAQSCYRKGG